MMIMKHAWVQGDEDVCSVTSGIRVITTLREAVSLYLYIM